MLTELAVCCDEFLIHGVDVEGKRSGMEEELVRMLGDWRGNTGHIRRRHQFEGGSGADLKERGGGKIDFTVGSALDLFGGELPYEKVKRYS